MRWLIIGALLAVTPAAAKDAVLSCFAENNHQHLVVIGKDGERDVHIQWDGGPFYTGTADFNENRYLLIQQFGDGGTFRMIYDAQTKLAYGGTVFYSGKETKTPFNCVWQ
jgi:hypothetical protein